MTESLIAALICKDERFCRLLENELAFLGIPAVSHPAPPPAADGICLILWDCDSSPAEDGVATAMACDCPLLLFGRAAPNPDPTAENILFLRRPFALAELEKGLRRLLDDLLPALGASRALCAPFTPPSPPKASPPQSPLLTARDGTVTVGDTTVTLTPAEWAIFEYLYNRQGDVISRDTLSSLLGGGGNSVDVYICHLRTKIEKPLGRRMIHTVRGVGYRLELPSL
jgi:hypothetical protein